jgi:hypothetical protein
MKPDKLAGTDVGALRDLLKVQAHKNAKSLPNSFSIMDVPGEPEVVITHIPSSRCIKVGLCDFHGTVQGIKFATNAYFIQ